MSVCPYLYYNDAKAAKDWMVDVLGFEAGFTVENKDGTIGHAEVRHGSSYIMLATAKPAEGHKSPMDVGADTASVYVSVDDVDGLHDRAKAAGGKITKAPYDTDYGSRDFAMKDPEGRVWYFGSYSPHKKPVK
ncbi:g2087 [Coccomyxa elongata]